MSLVLIAVLALLALCLVAGAILGFAAVRFKVEGNPIAEQINALLGDARATLTRVDGVLAEAQGIASNTRAATADLGTLRAEVEAGELQVPDCTLAASQFFALLKGEHHARLVCSCPAPLAGPQLESHLEATVDMFLRAYGPGRR